VSSSVALGLLLALVCAVVGLLGFLLKEKGAQGSPAVSLQRPIASTIALFENRWWTIGIIVAVLAWGFHVAALALAPISLVQATIAAGLVLLTPLADHLFGHRAGTREWVGVALTSAGLLMLVLTLGGAAQDAHGEFTAGALWLYVGFAVVLSLVACLAVIAGPRWAGLGLGVSCGLLWGASDVTIKAAASMLGDKGVLVLATPEAAVIAVLSLVGLIIGARSLQLGPAVAVIAATTAAANVLTIASGAIVFGEPMPDDGVALAGRVLGFVLVIAGSVLTPAPQTDGGPVESLAVGR